MTQFITQNLQFIAFIILVMFIVSGYNFRRYWKQQKPNWQRNCWLTGLLATACFLFLAFVPLPSIV